MLDGEVQLYSIEMYGKVFYIHKNSIAGFWEDSGDKENIRSAIMLTSGSDLIFSVPLVELVEKLKNIIEFKLPLKNI